MTYPTITPSEIDIFTALRSFLLGIVPSGVEVIRGFQNRVPEPEGSDFIIMTKLLNERIETNKTHYFDNFYPRQFGFDGTDSCGFGQEPLKNWDIPPVGVSVRVDVQHFKMVIQLDIHGPNSGDTVNKISTLFRSSYATDYFLSVGCDMIPLYCSDPRQTGFVNAEQQIELNESIDVVLQINTIITTQYNQGFADSLGVNVIRADS